MKILFALVLVFSSSSLQATDFKDEVVHSTKIEAPQNIDSLLKKMSLRQKIGQLFIFNFYGQQNNKYIRRLIKRLHPGGLISFRKNISTPFKTYNLNQNLQKLSQKYSQVPLLLMLDQEGGRVTRIKTRPAMPSALSIGETKDPELSFSAGELTGELISLLGFNMNLAPVVDISNPFKRNFIGNRSFGNNPQDVFNMGSAFSKGLWEQNVLPTYKHFPGHGGITQDTHKKKAFKLSYLDELEKNDLLPFLNLKDQKFPSAVMVAHVAFPNIDSTNLPATFSKKLITDILKNKYKYKGLVITDDLEMSGTNEVGSLEDRVRKAFMAGCDLLMVSGDYGHQKRAFNSILKAIKTKKIDMDELNARVRKIISAKLELKNSSPKIILTKNKIYKKLKDIKKRLRTISTHVVQTNITRALSKLDFPVIPLRSSEPLMLFSAYRNVYRNMRKTIKDVSFFQLRRNKKINLIQHMKENTKKTVFFYASGLGSLRKIKRLPSRYKKRIIVINTTHPGTIQDRSKYKAVIDINTRHEKSGEWLAQQLIKTSLDRLPAQQL